MRALAYGLNYAPGARHKTVQGNLLRPVELSAKIGMEFQVSSFGPCLYFIFRGWGGAVGLALTAHIDDVLGCGEPFPPLPFRGHRI